MRLYEIQFNADVILEYLYFNLAPILENENNF